MSDHIFYKQSGTIISFRVAEQRRQRLKELEQQMAQLKKKMAEQSKIVKMKESTDKQMGKLGGEILVKPFSLPLICIWQFFNLQ